MDTLAQYSTVIIYALAILAALIVALVIWRSFNQRVRGRRGQRLGISEYHELDQTRRLVLVRRDNVEHLILIGGPADIVVESGIATGLHAGYGTSAPTDGEAGKAIAVRAAPRPAVFGDRKAPPPLRTVERSEPPPLAGSRGRDPETP